MSKLNLQKLIEGDNLVLKLSNFYEEKYCQQAVCNIKKIGISCYDKYAQPDDMRKLFETKNKFIIGKTGQPLITCVTKPDGKKLYFDKVLEAENLRLTIFEKLPDLRNRVCEYISQLYPVEILTEPNYGEYFAGMIKLFCETPLHNDDFAPFTQWAVSNFEKQFVINCYLQVNNEGGEVSVYEREFKPEDMKFRNTDLGQYGFSDDLISDEKCETYKPKTGDFIMFSARNYHKVKPIIDDKLRINFNIFVGFKDNKFFLFS